MGETPKHPMTAAAELVHGVGQHLIGLVQPVAEAFGTPASADKPDLVAFLTARWDEREARATVATAGPWSADHPDYACSIDTEDGTAVVAGGRWGDEASVFNSTEDALFIADNDPAYVLADIAAKRKILALAETTRTWTSGAAGATAGYAAAVVEDTLRALAAPFRAHPDFDPAWAAE